ncbi:CCR4-NOT transcription complex subunit 1 isoform X1, partial [Tanacetum coccineum]
MYWQRSLSASSSGLPSGKDDFAKFFELVQVLTALANSFHALHPLKIIAFRYDQKGWTYFHWLLVDLFQFMEPFLRNAELGDQMRNIVLSAFPRNMRLPDLSNPNLKVHNGNYAK